MENIRIYSKKISALVKEYLDNKDYYLFAATGDIDNLGVYVAYNGRSKAENLVDVYNRIIGFWLKNYSESSEIEKICFLPSGEEVFIVGIAKDKKVIKKMLSVLSSSINDMISKNAPMFENYVTVSFGKKIFLRKEIENLCKNFYTSISNANLYNGNKYYLELLLEMRKDLALCLDIEKFSTLENPESIAIFYRNVVFKNMLDYKISTRKELTKLGEILSIKDIQILLDDSSLLKKYGLDENKIIKINHILEEIRKV